MLVIHIYRSLTELGKRFLDSSANIIDFFSETYDDFVIMENFNIQPTSRSLKSFMEMNDLTNLINAKNMPESAFSLGGIFPYFRYMRK